MYVMALNISERDGVTRAGIEESTPLVLGLEAVGEGQRAAVGQQCGKLSAARTRGQEVIERSRGDTKTARHRHPSPQQDRKVCRFATHRRALTLANRLQAEHEGRRFLDSYACHRVPLRDI